MGETTPHKGIVSILKTLYALHKSEYFTLEKNIKGGYKDKIKNEISLAEPVKILQQANNLVDKDKPQYYLIIAGEAKLPGGDNLAGKFELFYDAINITIESATDELDKKIKSYLETCIQESSLNILASLIPSSLLDLLESLDDL